MLLNKLKNICQVCVRLFVVVLTSSVLLMSSVFPAMAATNQLAARGEETLNDMQQGIERMKGSAARTGEEIRSRVEGGMDSVQGKSDNKEKMFRTLPSDVEEGERYSEQVEGNKNRVSEKVESGNTSVTEKVKDIFENITNPN